MKKFIIILLSLIIITQIVLAVSPLVDTPVFNITTLTKTSGIKANTTYNNIVINATVRFYWYRNWTEIFTDNYTNIPIGTIVNSTLNSTFYNRSDLINVTVDAFDGVTTSPLNFSTTLTVQNSVPIFTSVILNSTNGLNNTVGNLTSYPQGLSDPDNDIIQNITDWRFGNSNISRMVFYFEFTGGSNLNTTRDYSSYNHTANVFNSTFLPTGGADGRGEYIFKVSNDSYINVTAAPELRLAGNNFIVCAEVMPTTASGGTYVQKSITFQFSYLTNNRFRFLVLNSTNQAISVTGPSASAQLNNWHWVCGFQNQTHITIIVDKSNINTTFLGAPLLTSTTDLFFGERPTHDQTFNGSLSRVFGMNVTNATLDEAWQIINLTADNITNILTNATFLANQNQTACVTPNDATADGSTICSNLLVTVAANTAPTVETPVFNVSTVTKTSGIGANTTYRDGDSNNGNLYFRWFRNGTEVFTQNFTTISTGTIVNSTLSVNLYNRSDLLNVTVYADDATVNSTVNFSATVTVANTAPLQGTPILNSTFSGNNTDENITVFNISTSDVDNDVIKNIVTWYMNNNPMMLLYATMEGGSNVTSTIDYSGSNRSIAVTNAAYINNGGYDAKGAYNFTNVGSNQTYLNVSNNVAFNTTQWTLNAWVYPNSTQNGTQGIIINKFIGNQNDQWQMRLGSTNRFRCGANDNNTFTFLDGFANASYINNWSFVSCVFNSTNLMLYVNGVLLNTSGVINVVNNNGDVIIGARGTTFPFTGMIDDVSVWNSSLTRGQILALYNNRTNIIDNSMLIAGNTYRANITTNDGTNDGQISTSNNITINYLNISLLLPPNGSRESATNLTFNFNVTAGGSIICSLFNNDTGTFRNVTSLSSIIQNANNSLTHNSILENNSLVWNVECISPQGTRFSQLSNFSLAVDRTNPILSFINPVQANTTTILTQNWTLSLSCSDVGGLFEAQVNITNSTGQSIYTNLTTNLTGTTFSLTPNLNFSNNITGVYRAQWECSDDHTAREIPTYRSVGNILTRSVNFETESDTNITIREVSGNYVLTNVDNERRTDRYGFVYDYIAARRAPYTFIYEVQSSKSLIYRNNSGYTAHFITGNHWIDFEGVDGTFTVFQNRTGWYVQIETNETHHNFSSLGGLNQIQENVSFSYGFVNGSYVHPQTPTNRSFISGIQTINVSGAHVANNITLITIFVDDVNRTICTNQNWCNLTLNVSSNLSAGVHWFNATIVAGVNEINITEARNISTSQNYTINESVMGTQFGIEQSFIYGAVSTIDDRETRYRHNATINITTNATQNLTSIIYIFNTSRLTTDFEHRNTGYDHAEVDGDITNVTFAVNANNITITVNKSLNQGIHTFQFNYSTYAGGQTQNGGGGGGLVKQTVVGNKTKSEQAQTYLIGDKKYTAQDILNKGGVIVKQDNIAVIMLGIEVQYAQGSPIDANIYTFFDNNSVNMTYLPSVLVWNQSNKTQQILSVFHEDVGVYSVYGDLIISQDSVLEKQYEEGIYAVRGVVTYKDTIIEITDTFEIVKDTRSIFTKIDDWFVGIDILFWILVSILAFAVLYILRLLLIRN